MFLPLYKNVIWKTKKGFLLHCPLKILKFTVTHFIYTLQSQVGLRGHVRTGTITHSQLHRTVSFCQLDTNQSRRKIEPQMRNCLHQTGLRSRLWAFSWPMTDTGGPGPLWTTPPLGRWAWVAWESKLSKAWRANQCAAFPFRSLPLILLEILPWWTMIRTHTPNKPSSPQAALGSAVYHSNTKQTKAWTEDLLSPIHWASLMSTVRQNVGNPRPPQLGMLREAKIFRPKALSSMSAQPRSHTALLYLY